MLDEAWVARRWPSCFTRFPCRRERLLTSTPDTLLFILGRKNFLFCGSVEGGGERAEVFFSLVQSSRRLGIDPYAYLKDVISRISTHPASRISELTPGGWKATQASEKVASESAR
jgi:hypothetical protein